ncbi:MAG: ferredoxin [bacterium]|jgi:ferredoxin
MKVFVDPDLCISCGLCVSTAPDIYEFGDDGKAVAKNDGEVPPGKEGEAKEGLEGCPVDAIKEK